MPYVPKYGGKIAVGFPPQFPATTVSHYSMSVALIELLSADGLNSPVSHGSGFLWQDETQRYWLVTARHVLSGKNPFDDSDVSGKNFVPERIRVHLGVGSDTSATGRVTFEFNISDEAGFRWGEDPQFGDLRTDIAALPIQVDRTDLLTINGYPDFGKHDHLFSHVGFQCFVVGYPTLAVEGFMAPVWRSGALASDPLLAIDGKPIFLVDAATGPGFSGSPVFRVHIGPAPFVSAQSPTGISIEADAVLRTSFVGVYAGRLNHPHVGAQTPFVFYANRVPIIIEGNASLQPLRPSGN